MAPLRRIALRLVVPILVPTRLGKPSFKKVKIASLFDILGKWYWKNAHTGKKNNDKNQLKLTPCQRCCFNIFSSTPKK